MSPLRARARGIPLWEVVVVLYTLGQGFAIGILLGDPSITHDVADPLAGAVAAWGLFDGVAVAVWAAVRLGLHLFLR